MKLEFFRRGFGKYSNIKCNENPSSGSGVVSCRQTDGHADLTKLIVAYHNFANAPKILHSAHTVFICFVFISEHTATFVLCNINRLVFITEMKSFYCAVRAESLNKTVYASSLNGYCYCILYVVTL